MSIDSIQPSHPLSFPFSSHLQSFPALGSFQISRFFTSGSQSFSFSISPSNEYSGLISFRMNWLDLFAVQGTLKTTVQKHQFFGTQLSVQLSHPYMTTGKTVALTRWTKPWASDNGTVPLTSDFYQDSTYGALIKNPTLKRGQKWNQSVVKKTTQTMDPLVFVCGLWLDSGVKSSTRSRSLQRRGEVHGFGRSPKCASLSSPFPTLPPSFSPPFLLLPFLPAQWQ